MAERSPWWRAFTSRKKGSSSSRDPAAVQQESGPETQPSANNTTSTVSKPPTDSQDNSRLISDETYDDSQLEPMFNEKTCRRNLRISRSGRFKEKRKIRATLPENNNFYGGNDSTTGQESFR